MAQSCPPVAYSYDRDAWSLYICVGGTREYVYRGVSPYHMDRFTRLVRRNRGRALNYLKALDSGGKS